MSDMTLVGSPSENIETSIVEVSKVEETDTQTPTKDINTSPSFNFLPSTPIKQPSTPITLVTTTSSCKLSTSSPATPSISYTHTTPTPISLPTTPSTSRTRLLSPRPLWHSAAKTLRRAASFASFGGERTLRTSFDESLETRRTSSEPVFEIAGPGYVDEFDVVSEQPPRQGGQGGQILIDIRDLSVDDTIEKKETGLLIKAAMISNCGPSTPTKQQGYQRLASSSPVSLPSPTTDSSVQSSPCPNGYIQLPSSSPPSSPITPSFHEVRASILSNSSELSAQWYRSPRERLGLYLTVTKRGSAPWLRSKLRPSAKVDMDGYQAIEGDDAGCLEGDGKERLWENEVGHLAGEVMIPASRRKWRNLWFKG